LTITAVRHAEHRANSRRPTNIPNRSKERSFSFGFLEATDADPQIADKYAFLLLKSKHADIYSLPRLRFGRACRQSDKDGE
jgi:hypothetical protein